MAADDVEREVFGFVRNLEADRAGSTGEENGFALLFGSVDRGEADSVLVERGRRVEFAVDLDRESRGEWFFGFGVEDPDQQLPGVRVWLGRSRDFVSRRGMAGRLVGETGTEDAETNEDKK